MIGGAITLLVVLGLLGYRELRYLISKDLLLASGASFVEVDPASHDSVPRVSVGSVSEPIVFEWLGDLYDVREIVVLEQTYDASLLLIWPICECLECMANRK